MIEARIGQPGDRPDDGHREDRSRNARSQSATARGAARASEPVVESGEDRAEKVTVTGSVVAKGTDPQPMRRAAQDQAAKRHSPLETITL